MEIQLKPEDAEFLAKIALRTKVSPETLAVYAVRRYLAELYKRYPGVANGTDQDN